MVRCCNFCDFGSKASWIFLWADRGYAWGRRGGRGFDEKLLKEGAVGFLVLTLCHIGYTLIS